ncbi:Hypothetical predicted protein [Mytilus galloprovincialis]|uniref:Uncharacterized protein n=1 Tax=Mytilus galloprovincialis TaxID=29158 RepID=A0A8B6GGH6_MYTGA|nr:Hypothetical predicted protein [Mytilus galloprovincialis]
MGGIKKITKCCISKLSGKAFMRGGQYYTKTIAFCKLFEEFDTYLSLKHLENITLYFIFFLTLYKQTEEERELVKKVAGSSVDAATHFMDVFKNTEGFLKHKSLWEEKLDVENTERKKNDVLCHTSFQNGQNVAIVDSKQFHIHSKGDTDGNHDEMDDDKVKYPKSKDAVVIHECYDSTVGVSVTDTHFAYTEEYMHALGKNTVEEEQLTTSVFKVDKSSEFAIDNNNTGMRESFEFDLKNNYGELELNRHHADIPDVTESRTDGSMMDVLQKDTKLTDENTAGSNGARTCITELAVEIKHKEKEKVKKGTLGRHTTGFMTKKKLHDLVKANVKENDKLNRETTIHIEQETNGTIGLSDVLVNNQNIKNQVELSELEELTDAINCLAPNWIYKSNKDVSSRLKNRKHLYWIVVQDTDKKRCNVTKEQLGTQKKYVELRWILDATPTRVDEKIRPCCQSVEIAIETELENVPFQKTIEHTTERKIGKGVDNSTQTIETCIDKSTQTIQESQKIDTTEKPVECYKALTTKREKKNMEVKKVKEMKKRTRSAHEYVSDIKVKETKDQRSVCREQKNGLSKEGISSKWQRCLKSLIKIRKPNVKMMNNAQKLLENKSKSVDKLLLRKRERFKKLPPLHL